MKRITIEGEWVYNPAYPRWELHGPGFVLAAAVWDAAKPTIEDIPDPLPTTPGERFWASYDKTAPCWWFVTKERGTEGVWYVSQHGTRFSHPSGINSTSIAAERLVRLPDPELDS